ncbi:MAG: bifunctional oligoribonuclease/PAP phosphatase NrnA [Deltaproteobacteria bacterium]|nr:bifunctional oligoribonuclease/PAP phosphatase NrnA [Deltaproteobacteria bacterium]
MIKEIVNFIENNKRFLLISHLNPDGDSLGSLLAFAEALRLRGKSATIYSNDKIPDNYAFLTAGEEFLHELPDIAAFDAVVILDCGDIERVGNEHNTIATARTLINIDHHESNKGFCSLTLCNPQASSTAEIVLQVLSALNVAITERIANCIYAAILTDTGGFCYSSVSQETLFAAGRMVAAGAKPQWLSENIYENNPIARIRLLAAGLNSLSFNAAGNIAYLVIRQQDLQKSGALLEHTEGMVDLPRGVAGVKIAILFTEIAENYYKVSLRSKEEVDVASVAGFFGGGGHINAAGCRVKEKIETLAPRLLLAAQQALSNLDTE